MNNSTTNQVEGALAAAGNMAQRTGTAVGNVLDATRSVGRQAGAVASTEMANLRADLDDLVENLPSLSEVDVHEAKERLMDKIAVAKEGAREAAISARRHLREGVENSRGYVKEHPLQAVGYAAAIGFLLGLLVARR